MSTYEEDVIRCQCCSLGHGAFDITFFRGFPLCDKCFDDDNVLRTCMELYAIERSFLLAEQQGGSITNHKWIAELKEFCFSAGREKRMSERHLLSQ